MLQFAQTHFCPYIHMCAVCSVSLEKPGILAHPIVEGINSGYSPASSVPLFQASSEIYCFWYKPSFSFLSVRDSYLLLHLSLVGRVSRENVCVCSMPPWTTTNRLQPSGGTPTPRFSSRAMRKLFNDSSYSICYVGTRHGS